MHRIGRSCRGTLRFRALAVIGLAMAGCGGGRAPAVNAPPASAHTAAEQAAVTNWLAKTNQMWQSNETDTFTTTYTAIDPLRPDHAAVTLDGFFGWPLTAVAS